MPTDQPKTTMRREAANRAALRVDISKEIDTELEREIAGTGITKREVVEEALRRELARMKKGRAA